MHVFTVNTLFGKTVNVISMFYRCNIYKYVFKHVRMFVVIVPDMRVVHGRLRMDLLCMAFV